MEDFECIIHYWSKPDSFNFQTSFQLFTEGYCKYEGKLLENLEIPSGATGCQLACQYYNGDSPCDYFIYNDGDKNCQFLSSTARTCDLIRGPPNPPLENCAAPPTEPPSTFWINYTETWSSNIVIHFVKINKPYYYYHIFYCYFLDVHFKF